VIKSYQYALSNLLDLDLVHTAIDQSTVRKHFLHVLRLYVETKSLCEVDDTRLIKLLELERHSHDVKTPVGEELLSRALNSFIRAIDIC
jgi:hypothetical protein